MAYLEIEFAIVMFETDTTSVVTSITLKRRPDGGADVSVTISEPQDSSTTHGLLWRKTFTDLK